MTGPDPTVVALSLQVAEMRQKQAELEMTVHALECEDSKTHKPGESVAWHDISDEARELEVAKLRGWERDVLLPVLGYHLPSCWPLPVPACVRMELIQEQWMTLWLTRRTPKVLVGQVSYVIRELPGLADDIKAICAGCEHHEPKPVTGVAS